ncbi:hypothetical protein [Algisphaera agarilytica]|uniref:Chromosomal replication initiation ATPase DnaA n=1 Tax=Algisphaera agarilytica TaxID=1385975 RepID=A0A7X0H7D3_9BACT|nr:hypothetical protein [Algisphaera agarilytica]MBB6429189.1 chromosomal replication initiation ATPase DnaA [Algisphaera agarilytica]
MIREEQITCVFAVIQGFTTWPRKIITSNSQGSSFVRCRTYAAVLMYEELDLTYQEIAVELELDSHSTVMDLVKNARRLKHMGGELELLKVRLAERLAPEELVI